MNPLLQTLPLWAEIVAAVLLLIGTAFALVGSWGLAKLGDFYKRLHGPSKATTLGAGCVLAASALLFAMIGTPSFHELLVVMFLFITAPVSAHLLVKVALKQDPTARPPLPPWASILRRAQHSPLERDVSPRTPAPVPQAPPD